MERGNFSPPEKPEEPKDVLFEKLKDDIDLIESTDSKKRRRDLERLFIEFFSTYEEDVPEAWDLFTNKIKAIKKGKGPSQHVVIKIALEGKPIWKCKAAEELYLNGYFDEIPDLNPSEENKKVLLALKSISDLPDYIYEKVVNAYNKIGNR